MNVHFYLASLFYFALLFTMAGVYMNIHHIGSYVNPYENLHTYMFDYGHVSALLPATSSPSCLWIISNTANDFNFSLSCFAGCCSSSIPEPGNCFIF